MVQKTIPCKICGNQTQMLGTKLCDRCWELESRIKMNPEIAKKILSELDCFESKISRSVRDLAITLKEIFCFIPDCGGDYSDLCEEEGCKHLEQCKRSIKISKKIEEIISNLN